MAPHEVNAYYNPSTNEIAFPAGILQAPYFNPEADAAVNYGAMGAIIGHELTHGFDDQGSQYDAKGDWKEWWTEDDKKRFEELTRALVKQFDQYEPMEGEHINGQLTLGENIADLGGLVIAYDALQELQKREPQPTLDGFTPNQRFFISFAQSERVNIRPEFLKQKLMIDPHSPGEFRVIGPVSNFDEFYEAFNCSKGDKLYLPKEKRVMIW